MDRKQTSIKAKWLKPGRIVVISFFFASALYLGLKGDLVSAQQVFPPLRNPTELKSIPDPTRGGDLNFDMDIRYATNNIPNPATGRIDQVNLRSYNGELVGPTVRIFPGQLLRMKLNNALPANDPSCSPSTPTDTPHCFNSTNLHTHGWHVSPAGNGDNVLLDIKPQTKFDYEYYLPKDHPAGTFWYHSHRHGSTALQVSSGMAGALIVEGIRPLRDKAKNGIADIDTILKDASGKPLEDRIFMFEQIQYDCGTANGNMIWDCTGKVGSIESYGGFGPTAPNSWQGSGRFTMINGLMQPLLETQAGKIERWRLIHGGVRDTINFRVVQTKTQFTTRQQMLDKLSELQKLSPARQSQWLTDNCSVADASSGVSQTEMAVDGLTRAQMSSKMINVLQPGYRSDVLMAFNKPGAYCVLDDPTLPSANINTTNFTQGNNLTTESTSVNLNDRRLLSMVFVGGGKSFDGAPRDYIAKQLVAANGDLPNIVRKDLGQLKVPEYVPHPDVPASEVNGNQELAFAIQLPASGPTFEVANSINPKPSDYNPYDPDRIDRFLQLGGTDEWKLTSRFVSHPFHIHVNPFQIIDILDPSGKSIFQGNTCTEPAGDRQYCDLQGVWRDTLFVKQGSGAGPNGSTPGYVIIARTRYERYIGDFVLHCHILDHEDSGMMQNVRIVPQGGYLEGNPTPTESGVKKHSH